MVHGQRNIEKVAVDYFSNLFNNNPDIPNVDFDNFGASPIHLIRPYQTSKTLNSYNQYRNLGGPQIHEA